MKVANKLTKTRIRQIIRNFDRWGHGWLGVKYALQDALGVERDQQTPLPDYVLSVWEDMTHPERKKLGRKHFGNEAE
jgi:hypothetical protein